MAEFIEVARTKRRMCKAQNGCGVCKLQGICSLFNACAYSDDDVKKFENEVMSWAAEHQEPVYETWFEYLLRIGVIPVNAPAGGEYQWIVESIKHKHISNDIAESLKLHPKEVQS